MEHLYAVCAVLSTLAVIVGALSMLFVAVAVWGTRRDARRYLERISGSIVAAKELVRRATTDAVADADGTTATGCRPWASYLPRDWPR